MSAYRIRGPELSRATTIEWRSILDGKSYRFKLAYRERYDCWDLQVATSAGEIIIDGIRVTEGYPLLAAWSDIRLPPGKITCVDSQGLGAHPTRDDWRERHYLRYDEFEPVEIDNQLRVEAPPPS